MNSHLRFSTNHFVSTAAAIRYYRQYGYDDTVTIVNRKLTEGEIHLGPPPNPDNYNLHIDEDGRYWLEQP